MQKYARYIQNIPEYSRIFSGHCSNGGLNLKRQKACHLTNGVILVFFFGVRRKDDARPLPRQRPRGKQKGKQKGKGRRPKQMRQGILMERKRKIKKKKGNKLKKAKGAKVIPNVETNFKKVGCGPLLIQQELERAKHLDQTKFATNLAFTENGDLCRLTIESCNQRPWKDFLEAAPGYFKCVSLGCGETLIL